MKISEVSEQSGLSVDTLRYYEKVGLLPPITRTNGGIREYTEADIKRIDFIKCMRTAGLPVDVLTEYFALVEQGDETIEARKEILQTQRTRLVAMIAELQDTLALLNSKIEGYEDALLQAEQELTDSY
ncbi:MAG: MerR family transcriptional regulator [Ardenticatenaceae bacterium]|nr:MerR family transcriptional regulator [Ardenticatenaceae bacterium]